MPELVSIKERIERVLIGIIAAIDGVGQVYRWDGRGLRDPNTGLDRDAEGNRLSLQAFDAMVVPDDETVDDGANGNIGSTIKTMPIEVHLKVTQDEEDTTSGSLVHNRWLLKLETAVMANPRMQEEGDGGEQLAIDTMVVATGQPPTETGQRESITALRIEVEYEHDRNDPAQGPGITHKEL
jgi:hypothetical protein